MIYKIQFKVTYNNSTIEKLFPGFTSEDQSFELSVKLREQVKEAMISETDLVLVNSEDETFLIIPLEILKQSIVSISIKKYWCGINLP